MLVDAPTPTVSVDVNKPNFKPDTSKPETDPDKEDKMPAGPGANAVAEMKSVQI